MMHKGEPTTLEGAEPLFSFSRGRHKSTPDEEGGSSSKKEKAKRNWKKLRWWILTIVACVSIVALLTVEGLANEIFAMLNLSSETQVRIHSFWNSFSLDQVEQGLKSGDLETWIVFVGVGIAVSAALAKLIGKDTLVTVTVIASVGAIIFLLWQWSERETLEAMERMARGYENTSSAQATSKKTRVAAPDTCSWQYYQDGRGPFNITKCRYVGRGFVASVVDYHGDTFIIRGVNCGTGTWSYEHKHTPEHRGEVSFCDHKQDGRLKGKITDDAGNQARFSIHTRTSA